MAGVSSGVGSLSLLAARSRIHFGSVRREFLLVFSSNPQVTRLLGEIVSPEMMLS